MADLEQAATTPLVSREKIFEDWPALVVLVCGFLPVLLGLAVIWGWYADNRLLIQVHPSFVPMQFNTALGFLLAGSGLLCLHFKVSGYAAHIISATLVLLGSLTLVEYVFGVDLLIDELFVDHYITVETSHPGRMAPNTALCFLLCGLTLGVNKFNLDLKQAAYLVGGGGSLIGGLGLIAFVGYLTAVEAAYGWVDLTRMAVHTAFGFMVLGVGFTAFNIRKTADEKNHSSDLFTSFGIPITGACFVATVGIWIALTNNETEEILNELRAEAAHSKIVFEDRLTAQVAALNRMALRWEVRGGTPYAEWRSDAETYVADLAAFQTIAWIGENGEVRWSVPDENAGQAVGNAIRAEPSFQPIMKAAQESGDTGFSPLISSGEQTRFYVFAPVKPEGRFDGYLVGVVQIDSFFEYLRSQSFNQNHSFSIISGGVQVLNLGPSLSGHPSDLSVTTDFGMQGETWQLRIGYSGIQLSDRRSALPFLVFVAGLAMTLSIGVAIYFADRASSRARSLADAVENLSRVNKELDQFAYVASHDLKGPMRGIHQLATWLLEDLNDNEDERVQRYLGQLRSRVERLQRLLDGLLEYARAGKRDSKPTLLDTAAYFRELPTFLSPPEGFRIEAAGPMPVFKTDLAAFEQVMLNLVGNAIKHHDRDEGVVRITAHTVGSYYRFRVEDDGPGIALEFQDRVFGMFQTLKPKDEVEATGMGLALVKKTVEAVGGSIDLVSDPEKERGSMFIVLWPKGE